MALSIRHGTHLKVTACLTFFLIVSLAATAYPDDCRRIQNILVLFDASGFMKDQDRYQRLLEQMRFFQRALPVTADGFFNVGLRHYGLKVGMGCENTESVLAIQPWDPEKFINAFPRNVSYGVSSLAAGLRAAAQDVSAESTGKTAIIIVGGGVDSCNADPIKIADQVCRNNPNLEIHTFQIGRAQDGQYYLTGIAQKGRGVYVDASEINNPAPWHAWMKRYLVEPCRPAAPSPAPPGGPPAAAMPPVTFDNRSVSVRSTDRLADRSNLAAMEAVANAMRQNPSLRIVLHGYSDGKGDPNVNLDLSRKRAQAVGQYLVTTYGIHASRISYMGHGGIQAGVRPGMPERMGRRVEFEFAQ